MRIAVLSDVHANLPALEAALSAARAQKADSVICLGDTVGYGPDPVECIELVRSECEACVVGNHDDAVVSGRGMRALPDDGQEAIRRHREVLGEKDKAWLASLPLRIDVHGATFVHASPGSPGAWQRLESFQTVQRQFRFFDGPICFVGHSHKPAVASDRLGVLRVRPGFRFIVDVGSVGQPRDSDPRLAFAMFDTEAFSCDLIRVHYDLTQTVRRLAEQGYPPTLADRLLTGV